MKLMFPGSETVLLNIINNCFDALSSSIPELLMPYPISHALDNIENKQSRGRVEFRLMEAPAYEAAIAQTAIFWALNTENLRPGEQAAAIDLAYEHLPSLSQYDKLMPIRMDTRALKVVDELKAVNGITTTQNEYTMTETMLSARFGLVITKASNQEVSKARTDIGELLAAVLVTWLSNFGFKTKGERVGYLLALQKSTGRSPMLNLPSRRRFHDLNFLECDPKKIIRNLKSVRIGEGDGGAIPLTEKPLSYWYQGFEKDFRYYSTRG